MSLDICLTQEVDFNGPDGLEEQVLLDKNITHNLTGLWRHVGVYDALYMSDGKLAEEIYPMLVVGVDHMLEKPDECRAFDATNGWGLYVHALPWLQEVAEACRKYPKAKVGVSK